MCRVNIIVYTEKNAVKRRFSDFWSSAPITSLAECMARIGTPMSTVLAGIHDEMIEPRVLPPGMFERLTNFWKGMLNALQSWTIEAIAWVSVAYL